MVENVFVEEPQHREERKPLQFLLLSFLFAFFGFAYMLCDRLAAFADQRTISHHKYQAKRRRHGEPGELRQNIHTTRFRSLLTSTKNRAKKTKNGADGGGGRVGERQFYANVELAK